VGVNTASGVDGRACFVLSRGSGRGSGEGDAAHGGNRRLLYHLKPEEIMFRARIVTSCKQVFSIIMLIGMLSACTAQQLRIMNSGDNDITGLYVLFPGPTADSTAIRVEFGDIAAGETTEYRDVPSGVYGYAAYEYTLDGQVVSQPVIDWLGESPIEGQKFTYRIEFDPQQEPFNQIQLIEVLVDEP
jgi:hypothetical protein